MYQAHALKRRAGEVGAGGNEGDDPAAALVAVERHPACPAPEVDVEVVQIELDLAGTWFAEGIKAGDLPATGTLFHDAAVAGRALAVWRVPDDDGDGSTGLDLGGKASLVGDGVVVVEDELVVRHWRGKGVGEVDGQARSFADLWGERKGDLEVGHGVRGQADLEGGHLG